MSNKQSKTLVPTVKQFMSQVLFTLEDTTTLSEAAQFFAAHKLTTIPVTKKPNTIVGVLSDFQLLRFLLKSKGEALKSTLDEFQAELDPVVTIDENDSLINAFRLMVQSPNHRIYAMNGTNLSGALSPKDLLLYMAGVKEINEQVVDGVAQRQIEAVMKELQATREKLVNYQKFFDDSPYLMHSVDMDGKIVAANKMLHFVLGYREGELVGRTLRDLYGSDNYTQATQGLQTVKSLGFHPIVSAKMAKRDGGTVRVDIVTTLKKGAKGQPECTITVGRLGDSHRMINYLQQAAKVHDHRARRASKK